MDRFVAELKFDRLLADLGRAALYLCWILVRLPRYMEILRVLDKNEVMESDQGVQ